MNLKKLYTITGVLAVLAVVTYFVKNSDSTLPQDPRIGQTVLDRNQLSDVTTISVQTDEGAFTLSFDSDRSRWLLNEQHSLPVNMDTLDRLIASLSEARLERVASAKPERIAELGFGGRSISFQKENGESVASIELGRETDSGKQLVKYAGEDLAFVASGQFALDSDPIAWLDKKLLEVERDDIRNVSLTLKNGDTLDVSRESSTSDWTANSELPEGKQLNQGAITRAVNRFANVSFTNLAETDAEDVLAAAENSHRVAYTLEDGTSYTFSFGRRPEVKVTKEVEAENEEGETVTEEQEEVETPAGPVYLSVESSKPGDPINEYMAAAAFEVAAFLYTNVPESIDALLEDAPEPEPEPEPASEPASEPTQEPDPTSEPTE